MFITFSFGETNVRILYLVFYSISNSLHMYLSSTTNKRDMLISGKQFFLDKNVRCCEKLAFQGSWQWKEQNKDDD